MTTESLSGLVEQLSKEMKDCMKEIVPRVLLVETNTDSSTANNVPIHIREYVDVDEEERKELNAVRIRTSSFLQTARKMQVALEEIIISKRDKSEEETLKQEIACLQQDTEKKKATIQKYTTLMLQWSAEFAQLEEETTAPL
ncbi:9162_t:CDS:2 [Paraglomus brasilianum]|uniref:9162_t:CDS:1 n=1 Tax=Paraglomus brasilianum TaxID=144538 RepID=A0A9N9FS24_9GLOM|nr:9162_t:CDS:2 [Paraglomus brasilianum]